MQQQRKFDLFVDQGDLAEMLNVNRSTINRYQRIGMPYVAGKQGEKSQYDLGICVHWLCGHQWALREHIELTSLQKVLWAMAWGGGDSYFRKWKSRILEQPERFHAPIDTVLLAIGFLAGADLLPWSIV